MIRVLSKLVKAQSIHLTKKNSKKETKVPTMIWHSLIAVLKRHQASLVLNYINLSLDTNLECLFQSPKIYKLKQQMNY